MVKRLQEQFESEMEFVSLDKLEEISDPNNDIRKIELSDSTDRLFNSILDNPSNDRYRAIVKDRANGMTYAQLANEYNISGSRARQIFEEGIKHLKDTSKYFRDDFEDLNNVPKKRKKNNKLTKEQIKARLIKNRVNTVFEGSKFKKEFSYETLKNMVEDVYYSDLSKKEVAKKYDLSQSKMDNLARRVLPRHWKY